MLSWFVELIFGGIYSKSDVYCIGERERERERFHAAMRIQQMPVDSLCLPMYIYIYVCKVEEWGGNCET